MGIKERRTKILLTLFLLSDLSIESRLSMEKKDAIFSYVSLTEKIQMIFDIFLNQKTRGTLSGLLKEGLIEKSSINVIASKAKQSPSNEIASSPDVRRDPRDDKNQYRLTEKGFAELSLLFPFCRFLHEKWDGKWRIISYEIPEKKRELRDRLRREMQGWGLGPWHRSFWITPHPVIDTLKKLVFQKEEEKYILAFEADHVFGEKEVLIEKVWGKTALDKQYRELFKKWHDILSSESEKADKFKKVITEYINILKNDPGLPKELIGEQWIGFEGFNIFKEIRSILLS
jgi:phenylacetic acid degradation operon negative regulatory protein